MIPGKKPASAEEKAQYVETHRIANKSHRHGYHTPGDHDAPDPEARAYAMQDQRRGHFKDEIAEEENA
jgi:hypothetical protein